MKWRPIAAGILGLALWWFLFLAIGIGFGALWPEYRVAARVMFEQGDLSLFVTPMLFANFFLFVMTGLAVGAIATLVGRSNVPALMLTALFFIYAVINHYVLEWDQLPPWYNLIVPIVIAGSIWLGGRIIESGRNTADGGFGADAA